MIETNVDSGKPDVATFSDPTCHESELSVGLLVGVVVEQRSPWEIRNKKKTFERTDLP
jgi:hypothetical protein